MRLTTNSCCELEDRSGKSFEEWNRLWANEHRMVAFRWMVWAALQDKHRELVPNPQAAGALIDTADSDSLMRVMTSFLVLQSDEFKELVRRGVIKAAEQGGAARPPDAQADLAGANSTSTPVSSV